MNDDYVPEHRGEPEGSSRSNVPLSNGVYDKLKFVAVVLLPALGALYFGLAEIWRLPKAEEVVGSIVVVDTFLGVLLQISNRSYQNSDARFDGEIQVSKGGVDEAGNLVSDLNVMLDPSALASKKEIVVKVAKQ